jgi:hypothetical protein
VNISSLKTEHKLAEALKANDLDRKLEFCTVYCTVQYGYCTVLYSRVIKNKDRYEEKERVSLILASKNSRCPPRPHGCALPPLRPRRLRVAPRCRRRRAPRRVPRQGEPRRAARARRPGGHGGHARRKSASSGVLPDARAHFRGGKAPRQGTGRCSQVRALVVIISPPTWPPLYIRGYCARVPRCAHCLPSHGLFVGDAGRFVVASYVRASPWELE